MANPRLFVRARQFSWSERTHYWSESQHAWGSLESATIYTLVEIKTFERKEGSKDDASYVCRTRDARTYVPGEGEWEELPDMLKLKTIDEWLADCRAEDEQKED